MIKKLIKMALMVVVVWLYVAIILQFEALADCRVVIGVAPGEEENVQIQAVQDHPWCEELDTSLDDDLQQYIWQLTGERGLTESGRKTYYAALIGLCEGESTFHKNATRYNSNGTTDYGLFQVNTKKIIDLRKDGIIKSGDDIYDPFINAKCGEYIFWMGYKRTGFDEQSYTQYLYGDTKVRSNKYTQRVWKMMKDWNSRLNG